MYCGRRTIPVIILAVLVAVFLVLMGYFLYRSLLKKKPEENNEDFSKKKKLNTTLTIIFSVLAVISIAIFSRRLYHLLYNLKEYKQYPILPLHSWLYGGPDRRSDYFEIHNAGPTAEGYS